MIRVRGRFTRRFDNASAKSFYICAHQLPVRDVGRARRIDTLSARLSKLSTEVRSATPLRIGDALSGPYSFAAAKQPGRWLRFGSAVCRAYLLSQNHPRRIPHYMAVRAVCDPSGLDATSCAAITH